MVGVLTVSARSEPAQRGHEPMSLVSGKAC